VGCETFFDYFITIEQEIMILSVTFSMLSLPTFAIVIAAELYGHNEPFLSVDGIHDGIEKKY